MAAGTAVRWAADSLVPTAVAVAPLADPSGGVEAAVAAPANATVVLADGTGPLDSAPAGPHGVRFRLARVRDAVEGRVGRVHAGAAPLDSLQLRRVLVLGRGGWETKFVAAALSERGWAVDVHYAVSPKSDVVQGGLRRVASAPAAPAAPSMPNEMMLGPAGRMRGAFQMPGAPGGLDGAAPPPAPAAVPPARSARALSAIDTATYSAVIAVDSTAARYASLIARYVRQGGGLLLWADAVRAPSLAPLGAGAGVGELREGAEEWPADPGSREALNLQPITRLRDDAVVLERRGGHIAAAARRIGAGRTLTHGYADTWRWRMAGNGTAPEAHRAWLAGLVAGVAYTPRSPLVVAGLDPAPLASLIALLGPRAEIRVADGGSTTDPSIWWVFALIAVGLLVEWASRRLRGAR
jgi:hypothetical protein